jgi:monoamine oxidase
MKFVNLSILATVAASATTLTNASDNIDDSSNTALILGAGAAGLAAAYQLQQQGITDFLIVEAADSLGGRIKSFEFADGTINEGAAWVQGTEGSWLWELVKE